MPLVNIYTSGSSDALQVLAPALAEEIARELTVGERKLTPGEVSIRAIEYKGGKTIAPIEVEIHANCYKERIEKSDQICVRLQEFVLSKVGKSIEVGVWLLLSEIGHSWKNS